MFAAKNNEAQHFIKYRSIDNRIFLSIKQADFEHHSDKLQKKKHSIEHGEKIKFYK
jgi:hypothetical protein